MTGAREITVKIKAIPTTTHTNPFMRPIVLLLLLFMLRPFFALGVITVSRRSCHDIFYIAPRYNRHFVARYWIVIDGGCDAR
jgi:hypothetical protein